MIPEAERCHAMLSKTWETRRVTAQILKYKLQKMWNSHRHATKNNVSAPGNKGRFGTKEIAGDTESLNFLAERHPGILQMG